MQVSSFGLEDLNRFALELVPSREPIEILAGGKVK
jgi:hypothetical protein